MNCLIVALALLGQTAPPLVPAEDTFAPPLVPAEEAQATVGPEPVVEASVEEEGTDPVSKNTWRLHFAAGGGFFGFSGAPGLSSDAGAYVAIGKPLYVAARHPHHQWITDSLVFISYAPGTRTTQLVVTPMMGTNWYFGPYFGLEWRAGVGFGATPGAKTNFGLGLSVNGALVFRPFKDDQKRIKLQGQEIVIMGFIGPPGTLTSIGFGLAFEMAL